MSERRLEEDEKKTPHSTAFALKYSPSYLPDHNGHTVKTMGDGL